MQPGGAAKLVRAGRSGALRVRGSRTQCRRYARIPVQNQRIPGHAQRDVLYGTGPGELMRPRICARRTRPGLRRASTAPPPLSKQCSWVRTGSAGEGPGARWFLALQASPFVWLLAVPRPAHRAPRRHRSYPRRSRTPGSPSAYPQVGGLATRATPAPATKTGCSRQVVSLETRERG